MSITKREIKRSNPVEGRFSPTSLESYMSCPRLYYYEKVVQLRPHGKGVALAFGSSIHEAIGTFYSARTMAREELESTFAHHLADVKVDLHKMKRHEIAKLLMIAAFTKEWADHQILGDEKRSLENGLLILENYCEAYRGDNAKYVPEFIECPVTIEMSNGTMLIMVIDRLRREGKFQTVVDSKTSSWPLTDYFFLKFDNSFQLTTYWKGVEYTTGSCDNAQVDAIKVPYPPTGKNAFCRRTISRTDLQLGEWENTYLNITNHIMEGVLKDNEEKRLKYFHQQPTACAKYAGCKYLPIYIYGYRHPAVVNEFTRGDEDD
ncbi:MAG: PD-(D/E)XK nuclease family protein [bacterium]|nr:PD-(D/E)XK nuclease family protein [bacterium]